MVLGYKRQSVERPLKALVVLLFLLKGFTDMPAFNHRHYVPSLRCKRGEFQALRELSAADRQLLTPLLEVQPLPEDYDPADAQHTADVSLVSLPGMIGASAQGTVSMIDARQIDPAARMTNLTHPLLWLCQETAKTGTLSIPVTGIDRDTDYNTACRDVNAALGEGIAVRLESGEMTAASAIQGLVAALATPHNNLDLILDLEYLSSSSTALASSLLPLALTSVIGLGAWRTVTLLGGSFPQDLSSVSQGITSLSRREWELWRQLIATPNLPRFPSFGDYTIQHPIPAELPPFPRTSASIRYTSNDEWLVFKGRGLHTPGAGGYGQYRTLSDACRNDARYHGVGFSEGDRFIDDCASGQGGTGNPTTWRFVGANQHMAFVARQAAAVP